MEKSIESIWEEGFATQELPVIPKIKNLYSQKSIHIVERLRRTFRLNIILLFVLSIVIFIIYLFIDAIWQGTISAVSLSAFAWYSWQQVKRFEFTNPGLSSFEYLKTVNQNIQDIMTKNITLMRFFYPTMYLIALFTIWYGGDNETILTSALNSRFPDLIYWGSLPLYGWLFLAISAAVIAYFSDKIYLYDVRLIYGRLFKHLKTTLEEMEELNS